MSRKEEIERLWQKLLETDRAIAKEAKECGKRIGMTEHYRNLKRDADKLRAEYERLKGGGAHNPLSADSGDRTTTRKVMGSLLGKMGPDSHMRQED